MFTGIITDVGRVRAVERQGDTRFTVETAFDTETVPIGASIANNGVCLTVVEKGVLDNGLGWFAVQASAETLSKTTLGGWAEGTRVNLERALKVGDELGGHIVSGHVDGVASVVDVRPDGESKRFTFEAPATLAKYVASKGSVALDGVSLTVNEVDGARFGVNIIPHTQDATTFGTLKAGDRVNLEIDMLARYVARLAGQE
ncbi:riboflavin synthase [Azospirillum isscasi]|uniref:Riboflavin synthase n=1 Tax=Azospirillum isscasi TaxID=3053926 RepID=A0ABU0WAX8_9PROT|nr:riboflavin synthase [Azospirillum isscasi]MDQ2101243.1 riboflavin synthase [Azospirillum isscasi]